jgi:hypothetical protein
MLLLAGDVYNAWQGEDLWDGQAVCYYRSHGVLFYGGYRTAE